MKIFLIILHYGDSKTTNKCIKSILRFEKGKCKLLVVDNNANFIPDTDVSVTILSYKTNNGYSGGMNRGILYALKHQAEYVFLLNNDILFTEPLVKTLIGPMRKDKRIGIIGPAVHFKRSQKRTFDVGGKINKLFGRTSHTEVYSPKKLNSLLLVDYISGCSMMVKREVFESVGVLDQQYFLYYEDVDFCIRAKEKGFLTAVCPHISLYHKLSQTIGKNSSMASYHQTKSALLFGKKHLQKLRLFNILFVLMQSFIIMRKNHEAGKQAFTAFKYI